MSTGELKHLAEEVLRRKEVMAKDYAASPPFSRWSAEAQREYREKTDEMVKSLCETVLAAIDRRST